jgi:hypothetical protein
MPPFHPMDDAHIAPPAMSVIPAMRITVSTRVSIQLRRMCASIVGLSGSTVVSNS